MCGIVGVAGQIDARHKKAFHIMLMLDTIRGPHSTGIYAVNHKDEVLWDKQLGTPWEFADQSNLIGQHTGTINDSLKLMVGHNRYATMGKVTKENAHPFDFENVIGVHNGTLQSTWAFDKPHDQFEVDSQCLYSSIDELGLKETIPKIRGAWSLAYYNKKEKLFHLFRNEERPMCYAKTEDHKSAVFASEAWMIEVACKKAGVKICNVYETEVNKLYTINLKENKQDELDFTYNDNEIKGKPPLVSAYYRGGYWQNGVWNNYVGEVASKDNLVPFEPTKKERDEKVEKVEKDVKQYAEPDGTIPVWYHPEGQHHTYSYPFQTTLSEGLQDVQVNFTKVNAEKIQELVEKEGFFMVKPCAYTLSKGKVVIHCQFNSMSDCLPWEKWGEFDPADDDMEEVFLGYQGESLPQEAWHKKIKEGCGFCGCNDTSENDADEVYWVDSDSYICPSCLTNNPGLTSGKEAAE